VLQRATLLRMGHLASLVLAANALSVAVGAARLRCPPKRTPGARV
jgi:hypothetical protein